MDAVQEQAAPTQAPDQQLQKKTMLEALTRRGIDEFQWRTLMNSLFPGARSESVFMVIDYCRSRKLDPMKKPCHIVPMKVKDAKTGEYEWRDVVMPGIYEYRTTAMRTGNYLGHSKPEYGPTIEVFGVSAPEWCAMTMYRRAANGEKIEFPVCVYFRESCNTKFDKEKKEHIANDRWSKAPIQMLTKVTEAAGLREAFPDEFGGEATAEEMEGRQQFIDADVVTEKPIQPAQRISEQQAKATAPAQESSQAPEPVKSEEKKPEPAKAEGQKPAESAAPASPVPNVGTIAKITEHGASIVVELNTGFKCSTKDEALKSSARNLQASERVVELTTTQAGDPKKFMPKLTEILPLESAE